MTKTKAKKKPDSVLERLILRADHTLCTRCGAIEPLHVGNGTPALAFIQGITRLAALHAVCSVIRKPRDSSKGAK